MNTQNIISTPDITGNIGSCTTKSEKIIIKSNIFRTKGISIATNSCTGGVEKYEFQQVSFFPLFMIGLLIVLCFVIILESN